jgi:hypothetical protein
MPRQPFLLTHGLQWVIGWNRMDIECGVYDLVLGVFVLLPLTTVVLACSPIII